MNKSNITPDFKITELSGNSKVIIRSDVKIKGLNQYLSKIVKLTPTNFKIESELREKLVAKEFQRVLKHKQPFCETFKDIYFENLSDLECMAIYKLMNRRGSPYVAEILGNGGDTKDLKHTEAKVILKEHYTNVFKHTVQLRNIIDNKIKPTSIKYAELKHFIKDSNLEDDINFCILHLGMPLKKLNLPKVFTKSVMKLLTKAEIASFNSYLESFEDISRGEFRYLEVTKSLMLPHNSRVQFIVTSADVIHSFAVPSLGIKVDAIPGRLNQISTTILRLGSYFGQCSEICGIDHGFMPIHVSVV